MSADKESLLVSEKSTHKVFVVPVTLEKHPNADSLSIVKINDYRVIVRTEEYKNLDRAAWLPPDSLVKLERPEFSFLTKARIKATKIRGCVSYGLMVPVPESFKVGDDVTEYLEVEHYDPEINMSGIEKQRDRSFRYTVKSGPTGIYPKYDVDSFQRYAREVFQDNEHVMVTEKIHGESSRYVYVDDQQYCGSRVEWKLEYPLPNKTLEEFLEPVQDKDLATKKYYKVLTERNKWWDVYNRTPAIAQFCEANPGYCLYGEIYGKQKYYPYDTVNGQLKFICFDILCPNGTFLNADDWLHTCKTYKIPYVPVLTENKFNVENLIELAEGQSFMGNHIREGIVVKPIKERWDSKLGRICLKIVSQGYLLSK